MRAAIKSLFNLNDVSSYLHANNKTAEKIRKEAKVPCILKCFLQYNFFLAPTFLI
jgi:hypothetical protein